MTAQPKLVRLCPACGERPVNEFNCENVRDEQPCLWPLANEEVREAGASGRFPVVPPGHAERHCVNGHVVGSGDQMCLVCGGTVPEDATAPPEGETETTATQATTIDGMGALFAGYQQTAPDQPWERFVVSRESDQRDCTADAVPSRFRARSCGARRPSPNAAGPYTGAPGHGSA